jgi:hypothetical protein
LISRIIFRAILVVVAFFVAVAVSLAVLFALGAIWAGNELSAAAPQGSVMHQAAVFAGTVAPALNALPGLLAAVTGEVLRIRSWMYYVLAGGASLAVIPILAAPETVDLPKVLASPYMTIFAAAGFAGGFVYWLLAGSRA